jgi:CBS domain-containing protein
MVQKTDVEEYLQGAAFHILEAALENIFITDVDGRIVYFNPAAKKTLGYGLEELRGQPIHVFYRDEAMSQSVLKDISSTGQARIYQAVILDKQGSERIFSIKKSPLRNQAGALIGFLAVSRDITSECMYQEELRALKELNQAVLDQVHDLVVVTDPDGNITYYNPMAEQITGFSSWEVQGRNISELYRNRDFSDEKMEFIRSTGEANEYEARVVAKDGTERILEVNKVPLRGPDGQFIGFASTSRDITRRRAAEERLKEMQEILSDQGPVGLEGELWHTRVADLALTDIMPLRPTDTLAHAAGRLIEEDIPGLPVAGPAGEVLGVVTLKSLLSSGLFKDADQSAALGPAMETNYKTIGPKDFYFEAFTTMVRERVDMLVITEGRHLRGLLTMSDLMRSRGSSVLSVLDGIEVQEDIAGLAHFRPQVNRILMSLVRDGAPASQVTGIITEFNDRITRQVIRLCENNLGPPPMAYAWLGLGSEGRKEQTLTTDQDNAIVYENGERNDTDSLEYMTRLSRDVVAGLERCGFALCDGGIMADQPGWSGGLPQWLDRVRTWVGRPTEQSIRHAATFLDFRCVYGERKLAETLREETNRIFTDAPRALTPMAEDVLSKAPPLGLFKRFVVEKTPPHKGQINLKTVGTLILVDSLRLLAVKQGLFATNTLERLDGLKDAEVFTPAEAASIKEAFETIMGLRLFINVRALREGAEPSNHINPEHLPQWHQQRLRDALLMAETVQKKVREAFWWIK